MRRQGGNRRQVLLPAHLIEALPAIDFAPRGRASHRDLVPRGHDQRRLALLVHTAEPTCVRKQLTLLPVTDAGGLAYLHRHTAARAGVAIARNYNRFLSSSFHLRRPLAPSVLRH